LRKFTPVMVSPLIGMLLTRNRALPPPQADFRWIVPATILWIFFFTYWSIASKNAANEEPGVDVGEIFPSGRARSGALVASLSNTGTDRPIPAGFKSFGSARSNHPDRAALLAVWAHRHLGRKWSAEVRIAVDHQLVRTGPYRFLRRPIYTAMLGMFVGTAIASGRVHSLAALLILALAYWRKTRLEEQILLDTFGVEYDVYRRGTWALVPFVF